MNDGDDCTVCETYGSGYLGDGTEAITRVPDENLDEHDPTAYICEDCGSRWSEDGQCLLNTLHPFVERRP